MNAQNVGEILDALAVRFGSTGAHLWEVLVAQTRVEVALAVLAWLFVGLVALGVRWVNGWVARGETKHGINMRDGAQVPGLIAFGVGCVAATVQSFIAASAVLNPEYYALMKVLGAFQ